jgi:cell division protein FtsQ
MKPNRRHLTGRRFALPSLPRISIAAVTLRRFAAAAIGLGLAVALWCATTPAWTAIRQHEYFALSTVETAGNLRLSRDELLEWAGVGMGSSIWDATPHAVAARLRGHPWIEQARVKRSLPGSLSIRIRERVPVAILGVGELRYVDRSGQVLGALQGQDSRDFPIITGLSPDDAEFFDVGLHRALQLLRWCERLRCFDTISEIHIDRVRGVTIFPLRNAVPVVLGWGRWREKLERSGRVFALWQGQVHRLREIDVSFRKQAVVKLREVERPTGRPAKKGLRI